VVTLSKAKVADSVPGVSSRGGGRHSARSLGGHIYTAYLRTNVSGKLALWVGKHFLSPAGASSLVAQYHVKEFTSGTIANHITVALDMDLNGATESVVICWTDSTTSWHNDTIYCASMDVAAPGNFTLRDDITINGTTGPLQDNYLGFQVLGRNGSGSVHCIYERRVATSTNGALVKHRTLATLGGTWSNATNVSAVQVQPSSSGYINTGRTLAACRDTSGVIHAIYLHRDAATPAQLDLYYVQYVGASWVNTLSIYTEPSGFDTQIRFSPFCVTADINDDVHVWFANRSPGGVTGTQGIYLKRTSGTWAETTVFSGGMNPPPLTGSVDFFSTAISADNDGNPHLWGTTLYQQPNYTDGVRAFYARNPSAWVFAYLEATDLWGYDHITSFHSVGIDVLHGSIPAGSVALVDQNDDADESIIFTDDFELGGNPNPETAISIGSVAAHNYVNGAAFSHLQMDQVPVPTLEISVSAETGLTLGQTVRRTYFASTSTSLEVISAVSVIHTPASGSLSQVAITSVAVVLVHPKLSATTAISLGQAVFSGHVVSSAIAIGQVAVGSGGVFEVSASTALAIGSVSVGSFGESCETDYQSNPAIPDDPDASLVVLFDGPYGAPTIQMQMRRPDFGDVREVITKERVSYMRDGSRLIYRRSPVTRVIRLTWEQLSRRQSLEFENFFDTLRGQVMKYTDPVGHVWQVYSLENPGIVTEGPEQATVSVVLEGAKVN
jgi:hypothetical protein